MKGDTFLQDTTGCSLNRLASLEKYLLFWVFLYKQPVSFFLSKNHTQSAALPPTLPPDPQSLPIASFLNILNQHLKAVVTTSSPILTEVTRDVQVANCGAHISKVIECHGYVHRLNNQMASISILILHLDL